VSIPPLYKETMRKLRGYGWRYSIAGAALLAGCATASAPLEPPIINLTDLRLQDVQLFEQRYGLALRVQNPNPYELPIRGMAYRVMLNDVELGRGTSREVVTIPPYGETIVQVDVVSNAFSLLQRVQDLAAGNTQSLNFAITGNMSLADRADALPFSFSGEIGTPRS
jgi:LEA14-like dessication related protein